MKRSLLIDLVKLIGVFAILWGVFAIIPFSTDSLDLEISIEKEEKIGDLIIEQLLDDPAYDEVKHPLIDSAMFIIEKRLLGQVGLTDYEYNIRVIENDQVNAVTLPGGNIFVYKGLLEFADSPEEVAAVLAHEIGHVEKRHVMKKLVKEFGLTILFSILTGGDAVLISEIGRTAASSVFDRSQEREADDYALDLLTKSGISPRSLAVFFRRIKDEKGSYNENLEVLMTHPHVNSRIKASLEYKIPEDFKEKPCQIEWKRVQQALLEEGTTTVN